MSYVSTAATYTGYYTNPPSWTWSGIFSSVDPFVIREAVFTPCEPDPPQINREDYEAFMNSDPE